MKKSFLFICVVLSIGILTGCSNKQPQPKTKSYSQQCHMDGKEAPSWVCNGGANMGGGIYAMGSAEANPIGYSFQLTEAKAAARDALARQLQVKVNNMFKQFQATTGIGKNQTADKATQNVSKQVSSQVLSNSKVIDTWKSPKGVLFVLLGIKNVKNLKENVINTTKSSFKKDSALWQKFLATKADKDLDKAVEKEFGAK